MLVRLDNLPVFQVETISTDGNAPRLTGTFTHLRGVHRGRSWLYAGDTNSLIGDTIDLDAPSRRAIFDAPFWTPESPIQLGSLAPWIDGYWQAYHVTMILDPASGWQRKVFVPSDAQHFSYDDKYAGWTKIGSPLGEGYTPTWVQKDGWDHEHCAICWAKIGHGGQEYGYLASRPNQWLCSDCYERYAKLNNLEFLMPRSSTEEQVG